MLKATAQNQHTGFRLDTNSAKPPCLAPGVGIDVAIKLFRDFMGLPSPNSSDLYVDEP